VRLFNALNDPLEVAVLSEPIGIFDEMENMRGEIRTSSKTKRRMNSIIE
jgi:hypothetical protein